MTTDNEKQFINEETSIESVEYFRTPEGKNVTRKVIREADPEDDK